MLRNEPRLRPGIELIGGWPTHKARALTLKSLSQCSTKLTQEGVKTLRREDTSDQGIMKGILLSNSYATKKALEFM